MSVLSMIQIKIWKKRSLFICVRIREKRFCSSVWSLKRTNKTFNYGSIRWENISRFSHHLSLARWQIFLLYCHCSTASKFYWELQTVPRSEITFLIYHDSHVHFIFWSVNSIRLETIRLSFELSKTS